MRRSQSLLLGTAFFLVGLLFSNTVPAQNAEAEISELVEEIQQGVSKKGIVLPITDDFLADSGVMSALGDLVELCDEEGAALIVLEIDSKGGNTETGLRLMERVAQVETPVVAWVKRSALASASWIALSADDIYLAPGAYIGAGSIRSSIDPDLAPALQEKEVARQMAVIKTRVRAVAKARGHRVEIAEAFVDASKAVVIDGEEIVAEGEFLVLDSEEASRDVGGRPLLSAGTKKDHSELAEAAGFAKKFRIVENPPKDLREWKEFLAESKTETEEKGSTEEKPDLDPVMIAGGGEGEGLTETKDATTEATEEVTTALKTKEESLTGKVLVIPVGENDLVNSKRFRFMLRMLDRADEEGAAAVVFDIDTPGGFAWDTNSLMARLQRLKVPSYSFVNTRAISAGALISCATDTIYMTPGGSIGAAAVVSGGGESMGETERAKYDSAFSAMSRGIIREKGRHVEIVQAMMVPPREDIVVEGETLVEEGGILTLTSREATLPYKGSTVLAKGIVNDISELLEKEGIEAETVDAKPLGFEKFAQWVTRFSGLILAVGILGGYTEMKAPGFGLPGAISIAAFTLFFFGHYVAGFLAGWEAVVIFFFGIVLIGIEIFLIPGTLICGLVGFFMAIGGLVYTMAGLDFRLPGWSVEPVSVGTFQWPLLSMAIALIGSIIGIMILMRYLPETRFMSRLVLGEEIKGGTAQGDQPKAAASGPRSKKTDWVGEEGIAETPLRPVGRVRFNQTIVEVVADGSWIDAGEAVRVVSQEGNEVNVEAV